MLLEEMIARVETRLETAYELGVESWIARLEARHFRLVRRLDAEKGTRQETSDGTRRQRQDGGAVADAAFFKHGFGPAGRPRRDRSQASPRLHLPKRVSLSDFKSAPAVAPCEVKAETVEEKTPQDGDFVFTSRMCDPAAELTLSAEEAATLSAYEAKSDAPRRRRTRPVFRQSQ